MCLHGQLFFEFSLCCCHAYGEGGGGITGDVWGGAMGCQFVISFHGISACVDSSQIVFV